MTMRIIKRLQDGMVARDGALTRRLTLVDGGDLGQVPARLKPDAVVTTTCGFCSTGCGLDVHLKKNEAVNLSPAIDHPVNLGMACPKGWASLHALTSSDRGTVPLERDETGVRRPVSWPHALETFSTRIKAIQTEHGNEAVAFLSTGQMATEEMALLGALAKFGMGMIHGDGNTRQCMATAATAYKQSFGFDAPPFTYTDFERSDVLVFVGANPCIAHPIMWERVARNPHRPAIVVVDPRKTETAMAATHHLAISPKSDLHLFNGLARVFVENDWCDRAFLDAHVSGFEAFCDFAMGVSLETVSLETGLSIETLHQLAELIHNGKRVSFYWTMGVNQSFEGTRVAQSIINLALITGNIGRPGTGANSITGQCNAMGSRLFSNTTNLLGGHAFENAAHREKIAQTLGIPASSITSRPSLPYHRILEEVRAGRIKALWVICTDPFHSWIEQGALDDVRNKLSFLVVQDMYHNTETAKVADLYLPAAAWGEKEGTFINSERRISTIKKVSRAPGQALSDFRIFKLVAHAFGCADLFTKWQTPEDVFHILKACSRGQPCDITGIEGYRHLDERGGIQWPYPKGETALDDNRRLFSDGQFFHADKRAKLLFESPGAMPEPVDAAFPYLLLTGRGASSKWHTESRTRQSAVLKKLGTQVAYVEINPDDAAARGISNGSEVEVASRRGRIRLQAILTPTVSPGQLFVPMHIKETNILTKADFDPHSHQPSYKACAVSICAM